MQHTHPRPRVGVARRTILRVVVGLAVGLGIAAAPRTAHAQIDPLAIIKRNLVITSTAPSFKTHLLVAMDTSLRMQYDADGNYYDPYDYSTGNVYDTTLAISAAATRYRRMYTALQFTSSGSPKFEATTISAVGNNSATAYANFYAKTRLGIAKAALIQAISENNKSARFGYVGMRQGSTPSISQLNDGNVQDDDVAQAVPTDTGLPGQWYLTRGKVTADNGSAPASSPVARVQADSSTANTDIVTLLNKTFTTSGAILPAGNDSSGRVDAPLSNLLTDVKSEANRLITADSQCRNTIAVLITGGGEGNSATPSSAASVVATAFKTISSRRVPIYVIALAPAAASIAELQAIATNSGGQYFEVSKAEIDAAVAAGVPVPKVIRGIELAVQHGMANPSDVNTAPTASLPYGPQSEFLVTSPVTGTVNLSNAKALDGSTLPDTDIKSTKSGADVPQRANVLVTTGFALPGFDMRMRAYRLYKPATDATKPTGYKFTNDGTALWVAQTPMAGYCNDATASCRNIFTYVPGVGTIAFTDANAATLSPYLNSWDAAGLIDYVRTQPLGAVISSTPAFMDPPSLDPPPDSDYPGFAADHEDRRTLIFIGANDGMMHAIDARTGIEVWAFIPFNLLPKLRTLRDGQGVDSYGYFVDTSAKVADVKIGGQWRTMVTFGEGIGGTFYQAFDASLDDMAVSISPDSDSVSSLLNYFNDASRINYLWAFPRYSVFDSTVNTTAMPYGDLMSSASVDEKSVGQTWSDPAVGQIKDTSGPYTIIVGSGFMPRSVENGTARAGATAGQRLYLLSAEDGHSYASTSVGNDGVAETDDDCAATTYGCTKFKNALQADPVATGPSDQRFVTKAYIGDLDGKIWKFNIDLDSSSNPKFNGSPIALYTPATAAQPIFSSMAAVSVGTQEYLFVGTGSDLLSSVGVGSGVQYQLLGVLDQGTTGAKKFQIDLAKVDGSGDDEKVSSFPAVAGDIVFFTTTAFKPTTPCSKPDAALYALTFIGGAAYDSTGDNKVSSNESPKVRTLSGAGRATAPFIVDQHLAFAAGDKIELLGDPADYNNGVGDVGVRILSWRDVR
jgi:hypothetical protein